MLSTLVACWSGVAHFSPVLSHSSVLSGVAHQPTVSRQTLCAQPDGAGMYFLLEPAVFRLSTVSSAFFVRVTHKGYVEGPPYSHATEDPTVALYAIITVPTQVQQMELRIFSWRMSLQLLAVDTVVIQHVRAKGAMDVVPVRIGGQLAQNESTWLIVPLSTLIR